VLIIYVWCVALAVGGYAIRWSAGPVKAVAFVALFAVTGFMAYWLGLFEAVYLGDDATDGDGGGNGDVAEKSTK